MKHRSGWAELAALGVLVLSGLVWPGVTGTAYGHDALPIQDVSGFGDARTFGSTTAVNLSTPVVGMARAQNGAGYWEAAADGGVFAFGSARFYGSMGGVPLDAAVSGIAATADGYWLVGADGGVFAFGSARFYGSYDAEFPGLGPTYMNFVGMASTVDGAGYWLVASGFCTSEGGTLPVSSTESGAVTGLAEVNATHPYSCLDQVQFRFTTPAPGVNFDVHYVSEPMESPSGMPVHMAGNAFLQITLHSILADSYTGPTDILPSGTANIAELRETQNFEGYVTWVIGLNQMKPFWVGQPPPDGAQGFVVDIG